MVKRNKNLMKLQAGYLFPEINRRKNEFLEENPEADIISLGIGDTTEPLSPSITKGLMKAAEEMGTKEGYSGYGAEQGMDELRKKIAERLYGSMIDPDEVFISDGAKPDTGRLQMMFGSDIKVAVQDPSYPVYVDSSVIMGQTGEFDKEKMQFEDIIYMPCTPENNFFPDLSAAKDADVIFFCSPNNPTGAVATKAQLKELVMFAKENRSIIIFDAAYSMFITDPELPKTIYEIEGAKDVAIEVNSFSKPAGFTGVRLGWTIVPKELKYDDGFQVIKDFNRITTTIFNGASNIIQKGGLAALEPEGMEEMASTIRYYMENASLIRSALTKKGLKCYGGDNAPYIWVSVPGKRSWEVFDDILKKTQIICTPGGGFGPAGDEFVRFSAFGSRDRILAAIRRLEKEENIFP